MEKKYRLLDETKTFEGRTLHRILALKDFRDVKDWDVGGWVESENNLSHNGTCWVDGDAIVMDNAVVMDDAVAMNLAIIRDSIVMDSATIQGESIITGKTIIKANALVHSTIVDGNTTIGKNGFIIGRNDYITIQNIGSRYDAVTFYLDDHRHIWVSTGCFNDTLEAFKETVVEMYGENYFIEKYLKTIEYVKYKLIYDKTNQ